jgi:hypothetical protein
MIRAKAETSKEESYSVCEKNKRDRQYTYDVILRRICATIVAVGKGISITHTECMSVALGIQHAMRVRHIVTCCLSNPTIFFDVTSQTTQFSKNKLFKYNEFLLSLQSLSETFFILRRTERNMIINAYVKYTLFLSDF